MKASALPTGPLLNIVEDALALLEQHAWRADSSHGSSDPLPSLFEQCEILTAAAHVQSNEPVRLLHHFACTGGTIIAKCLALMPNTILLSEIDPLSTLHIKSRTGQFSPTDIILGMRTSVRPLSDELVGDVGIAQIKALRDGLRLRGQRLILRDHTHSHFCTHTTIESRPTLRSLLENELPVISLITVRHPIDSFLSLKFNNWSHFSPFTIDEYCRRYGLFLDAYPDIPIFRYEEFTSDPEYSINEMCRVLKLPYRPGSEELLSIVKLSGDSGRKANIIAGRSRRQLPEGFAMEMQAASLYVGLCERLQYDP